jgi:hypothetical protein
VTAPLTDELLAEILAHVPNCRYGCVACESAPALVAEIRLLRGDLSQIHDTLAGNRLAHALATIRMIATEGTTDDADLLRRVILEQLAPLATAGQHADAGTALDRLRAAAGQANVGAGLLAMQIVKRATDRMREYDEHGVTAVNVRQVLGLLSPTWPDGNYVGAAPGAGQ